MSDYIGFQRTNFVKVKDTQGFEEYARKLNARIVTDNDPSKAGKYALIPKDGYMFSDMSEEEEVRIEQIVNYLEEGEVLILQESGRQGTRYCTGNSVAIRAIPGAKCGFEYLQVNIDDIYTKVKDTWGVQTTTASN